MSSKAWSIKVECDNCMTKYPSSKKKCTHCGAENYELVENEARKSQEIDGFWGAFIDRKKK